MTRNKTFHMRCDHIFQKNLQWLADEMGVSKSQAVEIAVNLFPELVKMHQRLEKMIKDAKEQL